MLHDIIDFIVSSVSSWGYAGIFVMMFLESSFFPFPSEVAMIPAGYLAHKGEMSLALAFISGTQCILQIWLKFIAKFSLANRSHFF